MHAGSRGRIRTESIRAVTLSLLLVLSASVAGVASGSDVTTVDSTQGVDDAVASSDWPTAGHDPARTGTTANSSGPKTDSDARWIYEFADDDWSVPTVVSDGLVFVAGYQSLRAVDNETGEEVWNVTGIDNYDEITVSDGVVVTTEAGTSGEIHAYHATNGTEIWNQTSYGADASVVLDGVLYVALGEVLYAYDLQTGTQQWYENTYEDISIGLSAADDTIYATGQVNNRDYAVYALNASDGSERWRFEMEGPVSMSPVVSNGSVYVGAGSEPRDQTDGAYDPKFYRLNATDGHIEWVFDANTRPHGAAVAGDSVYLAAGNTIYGLDVASGERQWLHRLSGSPDYGLDYTRIDALPPAIANGTVYVTNDRGHLVALDGTDGTELWNYRLEGEPTRPAIADDRVYVHVIDNDNSDDMTRVYALEESPFQFSGFSLSKTTVAPGEEFTADVTIENVDDETRTYNLSLMADPPFPVDSWALNRSNGTLDPGQTTTLTFTGQLNTSGSWNVSVKRLLETESAVDPVTVDVVHPTRDDEWSQTDFDGSRSKYNPDTVGPKQHLQEIWNLSNFDEYLEPVIADGSVYAVHDRNADGEWADLVKSYDERTGTPQWEFNVSAQDRRLAGSPAFHNGTVYLYATPYNYDGSGPNVVDASVFALNASDGSVEWTYDTVMNYSSLSNDQEPVVANGTVFVAGGRVDSSDDVNASVLAIDAASGSTKWRYDIDEDGPNEKFRSVAVSNGTVVATLSDEGQSGTPDYDGLYAFDASTGTFEWSTSGLTLDMSEPPVVRDGVVYVVNRTTNDAGESAETLFALNVSDGGVDWEFVPLDQHSVADDWWVYQPVVTDDAVYLRQMMLDTSPRTNELYRLDPVTGDIIWNRSVSTLLDFTVVDGLIYAGDSVGSYNDGDDTDIYDAATGERYGETTSYGRAHGSVKAVANGTMITFADSTTPNDFRVIREGGIIEYTDISVDSHVVGVDENVTVTATATNLGSHARKYNVKLKVSPDGDNSHHYIWDDIRQEGLLQSGQSTTITWEVELRKRGDAVFTLLPTRDGNSMGRHMYDRAGSATVNVGDAADGQVFDLGGPRTLAPDSNSWPKESYDSGNTGNASGNSAPTSVSSNPVNWSVNHSKEWTSGPTLANDTVFVGGQTDTGAEAIFAYNATDGSLRWQYAVSSDIEVPPVYAGGYLYALATYGKVYQLNATTGERLWTFDAGDDGGITVVDDVAYITGETSSGSALYALNATTREILWTFSKPSTGYGTAPAYENGTVYVTFDGQGTYAVNASTGVEEWDRSIAGSSASVHSPVVGNGVVYVDDGTDLYALDATKAGSTIWSQQANVDGYAGSSPALANDTLFLVADGAVQALDATTGSQRWSNQICAAAEHSPVYADGVVFVPMADSTIRAYDASSGDLVWRYGADDYESFTPAVVGGLLYTTGLDNDDYNYPYPLIALEGGTTDQPTALFDYYGLSVSSTNVSEGEELTVSATVENQGDVECGYTANFSVDGSVVDSTSGTLGTGYYDDEQISFTHTFSTQGTHNVTIGGLAPVDVNVTAPEPEISATPSSYDYGEVEVGTTHGTVDFLIENPGTEPLEVSGRDITGSDAGDFGFSYSGPNSPIAPGGSSWVGVWFAPSHNGVHSATIELTNNATAGPFEIPLTGTGTSPQEVDVSPTSVDFGDVGVGNTSTANVTVSNVGGSDLSFDGAQLSGTDAAVYRVLAGAGTTTIAAGDSHNVTVEFEPTATGPATATLDVSTDDADESVVSVSLTGNGTIYEPNRAPVVAADHYTVLEGEWLNVSAPGVLANDLDPDGDGFDATHYGSASHGTLESFRSSGGFNYSPDSGFTGIDSFTYRVQDDEGAYSSYATVTIEVLADPNREPNATDDHFSVYAGEWLNVSGPGVLANDRDSDGDDVSTKYHGNPSHGTLEWFYSSGGFNYSADPWYTGSDSFTYWIEDEHGEEAGYATVTIDVLPPRNREPTAISDSYSVAQGEWLNVSSPGVLANDYDPDDDSITTKYHGNPDNGTLAWFYGNGGFNYTPDPGFTGTDSFVYWTEDEHGETAYTTVTIEVFDGNRAPTTQDDHYTVLAGEWLNVSGPGVLTNDYDPDDDSITTKYHGNPDNGTLAWFYGNGGFNYSADHGSASTESFTYWIEDEHGAESGYGTVTIEVVDPAETDPVAVDDHYTVVEGDWLNVSGPGVLTNDIDPNGDSITTKYHGNPDNGTLHRFYGSGGFEYKATDGNTGTETFAYWIEDEHGNEASYATVTIEVTPDPNREPEIVDDHYTVVEGEWLNVSAPGVLTNDYDPDGDSITTKYHGNPDNGTLHRFYGSGGFEYLPDPGFTGTNSFTYWIEDEHGNESQYGTVTIDVVPDPDATGNRKPHAIDDHYTVYEGDWLNVSGPGVLANDRDPDGDRIDTKYHGNPSYGDLAWFYGSGGFNYSADPGFTGTDNFAYWIEDEHGEMSGYATVTIEVLPDPNRPPETVPDEYVVLQGETLEVSAPGVLANDYDLDGDTFDSSHHGNPSHGTLDPFYGSGAFEYTPNAAFTGVDSFSYRVQDEHGDYSGYGEVTITVVDSSTGGFADVAIPADTLDFGAQPAGTTETLTLTVANVGDQNLTVSGATISGANASAFDVIAGNATTVLGYGGTTALTVEYAPTTLGASDATLTVHSDDPDEPTVNVTLTGSAYDDDAPTIHAIDVAGSYVNDTDPVNGTVVYENETVGFEVNVTDAFGSVRDVTVSLDAQSSGDQTSVAATENTTTGNWTATIDVSTLPDGEYDVTVDADDTHGNDESVTSNDTVVVDTTAPSLSASVTRLNATAANVTVRAPEELRSGTLSVEVEDPDGTVSQVTMIDEGDRWNGTFSLPKEGQYDITVTGIDLAGNQGSDTATARFANVSTVNNTVTVQMQPSGLFVRFTTNQSVNDTFVTMTESTVPVKPLVNGHAPVKFLDALIGQKLTQNLSYAVIGIPVDPSLLQSGTDVDDVTIRYFNETRSQWTMIPTTVENVTVNGTTDQYWVATVTHFSTYGAVASDTTPPTVTSSDPSDGHELPAGTTSKTIRVEYEDASSGVNADEIIVLYDGTIVNGEPGTTITSGYVEYDATGLTDGSSHDVEVTVEDEAGNSHTETVSFTVASAAGGSQSTTDGSDDGTSGVGDTDGASPPSAPSVTAESLATGGLSATITDGRAGTPTTIAIPEGVLVHGGVSLDSLVVTPAIDRDLSLRVTTERSPGTPLDPASGTVLTYLNVSHPSVPNADIGGATFRFSVDRDALDAAGASPGDVALHRHHDDGWTALETTVVAETDTAIVYEAASPGLSVFAVAAATQNTTLAPTTLPATITPDATTTAAQVPSTTAPTGPDSSLGGLLVVALLLLAALGVALRLRRRD